MDDAAHREALSQYKEQQKESPTMNPVYHERDAEAVVLRARVAQLEAALKQAIADLEAAGYCLGERGKRFLESSLITHAGRDDMNKAVRSADDALTNPPDKWLAEQLAAAKREGAMEAYDEIRRQAEEVGNEPGIAAKMARIVAAECVEKAEATRKEERHD